jgi:aminoglycoside phosphotransferase (APT) family kinase protein
MHAATAGREAEYDRVREALGPRGVGDDFHQYGWLAPALQAILEPLGVAAPPGAAAELAELAAELRSPGPFRVFTHGDPCPDNVRWRDGRPVIIDFDWSGYGHAMAEAVYGRIHFPTCWCVNRLPADLPDAMERAYRAALLPGCPAAGDDRAFEQLIAAGCVYWALAMGRLTPFAKALAEDRTWGIATVRQRFLLRAEVASQVAAERGHMEALGAALGAAAAEMRRRWPEADSLVLYPAFRGATP